MSTPGSPLPPRAPAGDRLRPPFDPPGHPSCQSRCICRRVDPLLAPFHPAFYPACTNPPKQQKHYVVSFVGYTHPAPLTARFRGGYGGALHSRYNLPTGVPDGAPDNPSTEATMACLAPENKNSRKVLEFWTRRRCWWPRRGGAALVMHSSHPRGMCDHDPARGSPASTVLGALFGGPPVQRISRIRERAPDCRRNRRQGGHRRPIVAETVGRAIVTCARLAIEDTRIRGVSRCSPQTQRCSQGWGLDWWWGLLRFVIGGACCVL